MRFLVHLFVTAVALAVAQYLLPGLHIASWPALLVAAFALGAVNAVVRPVLTFVALPITILTLGLFSFVVNGIAFALAAWLVPGFTVDSFGWAILGAIVVGVASWAVGGFIRR